MGFSDLSKALEEFKGWPGFNDIEEQAEKLIGRSSLTGDERIAWLKARGPADGRRRAGAGGCLQLRRASATK